MYNFNGLNHIQDNITIGIIIFLLILLGFFLIYYIFYLIGCWCLLKKAGKPGWAALIPFYHAWVLVEISDLNWWWFLIIMSSTILSVLRLNIFITITGFASLFGNFNCNYNIAKKFGKGTGYAVGLTLLPGIFFPIMGFSNSIVYNDCPVSNNGIFDEDITSTNSNVNYGFCSYCGSKITSSNSKYCSKCGKEIH